MKAYKSLVKYALAKDCTVSVWDTEEWQVKRSTGYNAIIEAIESVDMAELRIRDLGGMEMAWALIVHDTGDSENVADFTDNDFMNDWYNEYSSK